MRSGETRRERILRKNVQGKLPKFLSILRFSLGILAGNNPRSRSSGFMDRLLVIRLSPATLWGDRRRVPKYGGWPRGGGEQVYFIEVPYRFDTCNPSVIFLVSYPWGSS